MRAKHDGGPAFPRPLPNVEAPPAEAAAIIERHAGMSLRDWFTGQALSGWLSTWAGCSAAFPHGENAVRIARDCYDMADAMLAERQKGGAS